MAFCPRGSALLGCPLITRGNQILPESLHLCRCFPYLLGIFVALPW